jgi:hypothetical protein
MNNNEYFDLICEKCLTKDQSIHKFTFEITAIQSNFLLELLSNKRFTFAQNRQSFAENGKMGELIWSIREGNDNLPILYGFFGNSSRANGSKMESNNADGPYVVWKLRLQNRKTC